MPDDDSHLVERRTGGSTLLEGGFLEVRRDDVPPARRQRRHARIHPAPGRRGRGAAARRRPRGAWCGSSATRSPRACSSSRPASATPAKTCWPARGANCRKRPATAPANGRSPCEIHNAAAYSTESIWIYFARGLVAGAQNLDQGEFLDVLAMDRTASSMRWPPPTRCPTSRRCIGLQWLQRWRAGAWSLHGSPTRTPPPIL